MSSLRMTPTMLHCINSEGRIEEVSDLWLSKLGYEWHEVIGRRSVEFLSDASARYAREVVLPVFFETGACDVEYEMRRKDGTLIPVRLRGVAVRNEQGAFERSIAVIEDLTEQRALEQKMFAAQKLESLSFMAGNVAHDFNNLLTSIMGNAQLALRHAGAESPSGASLAHILVASNRAAELCRQLLAYSGRGRFEMEHVDLDTLIPEMVDVLQVNVGDRVTVKLALDSQAARIHVDATQIRQVLANLVINAGEAISGASTDRNGTIHITTSQRELDAAALATSSRPDAPPGRYVVLEVRDDGVGMAPEVLARMFDPFFTTKSTGRGLGLAAVQGIVHGHRGTLLVTSTAGQGTTFTLAFPPSSASTRAAPSNVCVPAIYRDSVLVIDDDELLRNTLAIELVDAGFAVEVATSASHALELARHTSFGAFLVDVTMPDMHGVQLAVALRTQSPRARIVMMSGFDRVDLPVAADARFLRKPFDQTDLLAALG